MQPYATPFYFLILGIALIPLIIAQSYKKKFLFYQLLLTIAFLYLTFGGTLSIYALIGFGVFQTSLVKFYSLYRKKNNHTFVFILSILLSIAPLTIVKITPFINPTQPSSILGFLGISYITFKSVAVILEIRDGLIKEIPIKEFVYFLYFFPTISSGPIDRFRRFQKELKAPTPKNYSEMVGKAIFYIFIGFLYNFIIAHYLSEYFLHPVAIIAVKQPSFLYMMLSMYGYGLYLFFDFAGYSLFAIGISYLMGYDLPKNFHLPFLSKNIKEFWNRWHMTLSFWFRDYVYMRMVKFVIKKKWTKNRALVSNLSYIALFGLMGIWHGLTWYYIAYGFYHAFLMIGYDTWLLFKKKHKIKIPDNKITQAIGVLITIQFVFLGFLIFSGILDMAIRFAQNPVTSNLPNF
ncbi:MAG: D-alanyl-lipoteichoic acid biosynthesis protein DltB [Streptococcaceae bacterium]|jgi:membrane protein involved in D-alanine export|nr:D-alanyl-lipoteichoic acid biosynthesis protein DltB [Streptococcaceae bacterium]